MSLLKYIETKKLNITISSDNYKEKLSADMAHLLINPNLDIRKDAINIVQLEKYLNEINCPFKNELLMAVKTADVKKIAKMHNCFKGWHNENAVALKVEEMLYGYRASLYKEEINPQTVDQLVESYYSQSYELLEQIQSFLRRQLASENCSIIISPIFPSNGWVATEAQVDIEGIVSFVCDEKMSIKDVQGESLRSKKIMDKLLKKENYGVMTLYMNRDKSDKKYLESIKRDLSLGMSVVLPQNTILSERVVEEGDVWKVKIDRKYLREFVDKNEIKYSLNEESPIRWLELIKGK